MNITETIDRVIKELTGTTYCQLSTVGGPVHRRTIRKDLIEGFTLPDEYDHALIGMAFNGDMLCAVYDKEVVANTIKGKYPEDVDAITGECTDYLLWNVINNLLFPKRTLSGNDKFKAPFFVDHFFGSLSKPTTLSRME